MALGTARLVQRTSTDDRLQGFRCAGKKPDGRACQKLLCEMHEDAIRPGRIVRVKCKDCNALNSFAGTDAT